MRCNEIQEKLSSYIDGMLSEEEMSKIREHLLLCPECNREYLLLIEMTELLGSAEQPTLPKDFNASLRLLLENETGTAKIIDIKKKKSMYKKYGSIAAVFLIMVISGSFFLLGDHTGGPVEDVNMEGSKVILDEGSEGDLLADSTGDEAGDQQLLDTDGQLNDQTSLTGQDDSKTSDGQDNQKSPDSSQINGQNPEVANTPNNHAAAGFSENSSAANMLEASGIPALGTERLAPVDPASEGSSVMSAAYSAGAETYNDALDFISLIADNNMEGLVDWIMQHSNKEITREKASELAGVYMEKYKASAE